MILFDWHKIFIKTQGSPLGCYQIIKMITYNEVPKNKYDPIYKFAGEAYIGDNFLVHPEFLIHNAYKYTMHEIGSYIAAASARDVSEYLVSKDTTLNLFKTDFADSTIEILKTNRLLRIEDDTIVHFLYEEVTKMEKH